MKNHPNPKEEKMLHRMKPTCKTIPLITTPEMRLLKRYLFWERVEYFTIGFSVALLLLILAREDWMRLGFPVFTFIIAGLSGYFKRHTFESAADGYKIQEKEV